MLECRFEFIFVIFVLLRRASVNCVYLLVELAFLSYLLDNPLQLFCSKTEKSTFELTRSLESITFSIENVRVYPLNFHGGKFHQRDAVAKVFVTINAWVFPFELHSMVRPAYEPVWLIRPVMCHAPLSNLFFYSF